MLHTIFALTMRAFLFVLLTALLPLAIAAQKLSYDMYALGNKIGTMDIEKTIRADGSEYYTLKSKATAKVLWSTRTSETIYEIVYKGGKLISSSHKYYENGKLEKYCYVTANGTKYDVKSYRQTTSFTEAPTYSIVSVYFKEPKGINKIFYEAEGDFSSLKPSDEPGSYEFKSSDGNRNIYKYVNGKMMEAEFHVSIITVKVKRVTP